MKIGILGGTFNPIHIGHLILAEEALWKLKLDTIIFVPAYAPPHKDDEALIDAQHRYAMVCCAIEGNPRFEASRIEIESQQKSYSIETLRKFKEQSPGTEFFFITGSDSLKELFSWKEIDEIFRLSRFIVATRPGFPVQQVPKEVELVVISEIEVSSSEIRKRLKEGRSIRYLVPDVVREYIDRNGLYT